MAEVKWIKIVTDVFDDEKILMIESLPDADGIIVIWFKLLCLAGKQNNSGVFMMGRLPYTDEMFSTVFRRPINTVRLALKTFEEFGMIEIVNNTVTIPNWDRHQSLDSYEKRKERDRLYQAERRAKQKAIAEKSTDASTDTSSDIVSKIRREEDKNKNRLDVDVVAVATTGGNGNETQPVENSVENSQLKLVGGTLGKGVVYMTDEQLSDLLDKIGFDGFNYYIPKLADFIIKNDAKVANHYATILKWWKEDSGVTG